MTNGHVRGTSGMALALLTTLCLGVLASGPAAHPPAPRRLFVAGASAGVQGVPTPWRNQELRWVVKSEAGAAGQDVQKSDAKGLISPRFPVPDVRVAVRMALAVAPQDEPAAAITWELVVLPKDPIAEVRKTLGALGVGNLPGGPLDAALARSGLEAAELQHDLVRSQFKGRAVVLGGLLAQDADATRRWVSSLPKEVRIIVVLRGDDANSPLAILPSLKAQKAPPDSNLRADSLSPLWRDFPVEWVCEQLPSLVLAQPRNMLSLRLLAAYTDKEGAAYPLAMESQDAEGHHWLIWNPAWAATDNDPRWDILLKNSLLWAASDQTRAIPDSRRP